MSPQRQYHLYCESVVGPNPGSWNQLGFESVVGSSPVASVVSLVVGSALLVVAATRRRANKNPGQLVVVSALSKSH